MIKFELLADLDEYPAGVTVQFDGCGAVGLWSVSVRRRHCNLAVRRSTIRQTSVDGLDLGGDWFCKCMSSSVRARFFAVEYRTLRAAA